MIFTHRYSTGIAVLVHTMLYFECCTISAIFKLAGNDFSSCIIFHKIQYDFQWTSRLMDKKVNRLWGHLAGWDSNQRSLCQMGAVCIMSWYPQLNGRCVHYVMLSTTQSKPFWLATQLYPQNDWTGWQNGVNDDVCAQALLCSWHRKRASNVEALRPTVIFTCNQQEVVFTH